MTTEGISSGNTTIAAISTARGVGAIGIVRMSGNSSKSILARLFTPEGHIENFETTMRPRYMYYGAIKDINGQLLDLCMAVYFESGKSYTGEDCVEIYCHGGLAVLDSVLNALYEAGAVGAMAGEFTKRAFLNGKMDLFSAEAVIDLIHAETSAAAKNAVQQLKSTQDNSIYHIRRKLIELMSSFYAEVDFPDEGVEQLIPQAVSEQLNFANQKIIALINSYKRGHILKNGVPVAIIGKPNAGKSSLLNQLCGKERAIVTNIEGTTRDVIEEKFIYKDRVFRLFDTAGIHESSDQIEQMSIERSLKAAEDADIIIFLVDGTKGIDQNDLQIVKTMATKRIITVLNKSDSPIWKGTEKTEYISISAKTGEGIDNLCEQLFQYSEQSCSDGGSFNTIITNERQINALNNANCYISNALSAFESGLTFDILLTEVEGAVNSLGEITGENASEDVISDIFSRFCVGK